MRFLAAGFIVLFHFGSDAPTELAQAAPVFARGWLATDFFLILSGFVLAKAYGPQIDGAHFDLVRFVSRRIIRIWPAHAIVLCGYVALTVISSASGIPVGHPQAYRWEDLLPQVFLVHAWGSTREIGWNGPTWTLSALLVCYLFLPAAWRATGRLRSTGWPLGAAMAVLLVAGAASSQVLGRSLYDLPLSLSLYRAAPLFLAGILLARSAERLNLSRIAALSLLLAGASGLALLQSAVRSEAADFASVLAIGLIILAADQTGFRSPLATRFGDLSFALFITHTLSQTLWFSGIRRLGETLSFGVAGQWGLWLAGLAFALGLAWAFQRTVDDPLQRFLKRGVANPQRVRLPSRTAAQTP